MFQCSLLRQTAPLESLIRDKLSAKQTEAYEWFFSEQVPVLVTSFVNYLEGDARFTAATAVYVVIFKLLHVESLYDNFEGSVEMILLLICFQGWKGYVVGIRECK